LPIELPLSPFLPLRWGLSSRLASVPDRASLGVILLDIFLEVPLANQLLNLIAERMELFRGVADCPMVLTVLAAIGVGRWRFLPGR